jgi:PAS domain S-box-containing protein
MAKRRVPGLAFLLAALCTSAAVYARWLLTPWLGHALPLATVFAAVAVSAWLGGYRPAIFATLAGYAASMYLFVDPRVLPLFDTAGEVIGFALYLASCAVIIVFGAGMRHAERRVTRLLESITDAFVAVDRDWRYTYVNAEAERLLGRSRRSMIGRKIWEVDADAPGSELERQLRLAADSRTTQEFEAHLPTSGRWFLNKVYPIPNGGLASASATWPTRRR